VTEEAHTSPKSHPEPNIWQRISLLKVKLPKLRLTQQVANEVSMKIKALIRVVKKSN
jgi:DNA-directed RNA polymerase subunit H (RpoH/RPB5)